MKKIAVLLVIISLNFKGISQIQAPRERFTLEQRNELQLKRMTLEYDLTTSQQKDLAPILAEHNAKRETRREAMRSNFREQKQLTTNERFEAKSKFLDEQIEFKAKIKKILTKEQYEKWEINREKRFKKLNHKKIHRRFR